MNVFNRIRKHPHRSVILTLAAILACVLLTPAVWYTYKCLQRPYAFKTDTRLLYEIEHTTESSVDYGALLGPGEMNPGGPAQLKSQRYRSHLRGLMEIVVLDRGLRNATLSMRIIDYSAAVSINDVQNSRIQESLHRNLSRPVFILVDYHGMIQAVWIHKELSAPLLSGFVRSIAALTQCHLPGISINSTQEWTSRESDTTGIYDARYRVTDHRTTAPKTITLSKTKIGYLKQTYDDDDDFESPKISTNASTAIDFDLDNGRITTTSGTEDQEFHIKTNRIGTNAIRFSVKLQKAETASVARSIKNALANRANTHTQHSLYIPPSNDEMKRSVYENTLGNLKLDDLIKSLWEHESQRLASRETSTSVLYTRFLSMVYLHPESCEELAKLLMAAPENSIAMEIIPGALASSGREEAQHALISVIQKRIHEETLAGYLLNILSSAVKPSAENEEFLRSLIKSDNKTHAKNATLGLGSIARASRKKNPERSEDITDELAHMAKRASNPDDIVLLIKALENTGTQESIPVLLDFSSNQSSSIRSSAIIALGNFTDAKTEKTIINRLVSDADDYVRMHAADGLKGRKPTQELFSLFKERLAKDSSPLVRIRLLHNLHEYRGDIPEALELIRQSAASDESESVRIAAKELLGR